MIKLARLDDVPALIEMGRKFHAMSPHRPMGEFDADAVGRMLSFLITHPDALVLTNGAGAIGGMMAPVYFNPAKSVMEESFWWADKGGRDLLKAFEIGATEMGADFISLSTLENERSAAIDRVVQHLGFAPMERRYIKEI